MNTWQKIALAGLLLMAGRAHAEDIVHYYYTDPQGTVLAKTDATGNVIASYDYAPYGSQALGTPPNGPGYTGHVNDPESGLVYMQARYYDPSVGRFLSTDVLEPTPSNIFNFNRYDYVDNNPVINTDPTGTTCTSTGTEGVYNCTVDHNTGHLDKAQLATANKSYTTAVNNLEAHPSRTVPVKVDGKSFKANAGAIAKALIGAIIDTKQGGGSDGSTRASTLGGTLTKEYATDGHAVTTIYSHAISENRLNGTTDIASDLGKTFIHEGIHMLPGEKAMRPLYKADPKKFGADHQAAYDAASSELYEAGGH